MNIKHLAIIAIAALGMQSCTDGSSCSREQEQQVDSVVTPVDSVAAKVDTVRTITGVAVDGGMNSIDLVVDGDTLSFDFPDLPYHVTWTAGDTMTVVVNTINDSVMSLKPAT